MTVLDVVITAALVYLAAFTLWAATHDQLALAACGVVGILGWSWIPQLIVGRHPRESTGDVSDFTRSLREADEELERGETLRMADVLADIDRDRDREDK